MKHLIIMFMCLCMALNADEAYSKLLKKCSLDQSIIHADLELSTIAFNANDYELGIKYLTMSITKQKKFIIDCEEALKRTNTTHVAHKQLYKLEQIEIHLGIEDEL